MSDNWRMALYYPLGLIPSIFFSLRFFLQWMRSERLGRSTVTPVFWRLSLAGNSLLLAHYFIQMQLPFALIQALNGFIAWRNLNLMKQNPASLKIAFIIASLLLCGISSGFYIQMLACEECHFLQIPGSKIGSVPLLLSFFGIFGQCLFACRFWIQWLLAEKKQHSELTSAFWWMSLFGNLFSIGYFLAIEDMISIINNSFGILPYVRNLTLIRKRRKQKVPFVTLQDG